MRRAHRDPRGAARDRRRRAAPAAPRRPRAVRARARGHGRHPALVPERGRAGGLHRAGACRRPTSSSSVARRWSHTLRDLAQVLGLAEPTLVDGADFSATEVDARAVVVVATQGHGDEDAVEHAVTRLACLRRPGRVAASAARRCSATSPSGACRSTCSTGCGCRSASTSGTRRTSEIAVADPRRARAAAGLGRAGLRSRRHRRASLPETAIDPVCGMTVTISPTALPLEHDGVTYYFCCRLPGVRRDRRYLPRRRGADQERLRRGAARRQGVALLRRHPAGRRRACPAPSSPKTSATTSTRARSRCGWGR